MGYERSATKFVPFGVILGLARPRSGFHFFAASNKRGAIYEKNKSTRNNSGWDFSIALAHTRVAQCLVVLGLTETLTLHLLSSSSSLCFAFAFFICSISLSLSFFWWLALFSIFQSTFLNTDSPLPELCLLRSLLVELAFMHDRTLDRCLGSYLLHHGFLARYYLLSCIFRAFAFLLSVLVAHELQRKVDWIWTRSTWHFSQLCWAAVF